MGIWILGLGAILLIAIVGIILARDEDEQRDEAEKIAEEIEIVE